MNHTRGACVYVYVCVCVYVYVCVCVVYASHAHKNVIRASGNP